MRTHGSRQIRAFYSASMSIFDYGTSSFDAGMTSLEELNTNGWMQRVSEFAAACRQCGALIASSDADQGKWTERHVAWHMGFDEF